MAFELGLESWVYQVEKKGRYSRKVKNIRVWKSHAHLRNKNGSMAGMPAGQILANLLKSTTEDTLYFLKATSPLDLQFFGPLFYLQ